MRKPFLNLLILTVAMMACFSAGGVYAWQVSGEKIVVLTNRQTLQGDVTERNGKVSVRLPSGSLIVMPDSKVEFVSESFADAYWELAGRTRSTDLQGQISVFKWCLRNELFEEASNHLLILQEMNIPAKTLMQLDVSLQITQKRHRESLEAIVDAPVAIAAVPARNNKPIVGLQSVDAIQIPNLHQSDPPQKSAAFAKKEAVVSDKLSTIDEFGNEVDSMVRSVSWDQPISKTAASNESVAIDTSTANNEPTANNESPEVNAALLRQLDSTESLVYADLDRLANSMPRGSVGLFRRQVEPLVQKACVQCHNANDSERHYKIFQSYQGEIDRRMGQKNLYQSLILSDRAQPSESALIRYATTAHGGQRSASFQGDDSQLVAMKRWLIMVSENPSLPVEAFSSERLERRLPRVLPPVADTAPDGFSQKLPKMTPAAATKTSLSTPIPKAEPPSENLDPFNAELFNQNFGSR